MSTIRILLLTCLMILNGVALGNDEFLGHWQFESTGFGSNPISTSQYQITIEKDGDGYIAWAYNGPMAVVIDGNSVEVLVDWISGSDTRFNSKLIGSLNDKGEITGRLEHMGQSNFNSRPLINGTFTAVKVAETGVNARVADLPPDSTDLTGLWRGASGFGGFNKNHYALTPKAQEIRDNFKVMDAPHIRCAGYGLVTSSGFALFLYGIEIFQSDEQITLVYGSDYVRRVYLDDREYPGNREDTDMGFSKGEWKGNTLVVTTTHLTPNFLRPGHGNPISGDARTIEHYNLDDLGYLHADMWVVDPENYDRPPYFERTLDRNYSAAVSTHVGCDAYSYYRQLYKEGELEEFFSRGAYRR
jgi:hypothetical protein